MGRYRAEHRHADGGTDAIETDALAEAQAFVADRASARRAGERVVLIDRQPVVAAAIAAAAAGTTRGGVLEVATTAPAADVLASAPQAVTTVDIIAGPRQRRFRRRAGGGWAEIGPAPAVVGTELARHEEP